VDVHVLDPIRKGFEQLERSRRVSFSLQKLVSNSSEVEHTITGHNIHTRT